MADIGLSRQIDDYVRRYTLSRVARIWFWIQVLLLICTPRSLRVEWVDQMSGENAKLVGEVIQIKHQTTLGMLLSVRVHMAVRRLLRGDHANAFYRVGYVRSITRNRHLSIVQPVLIQ